MKRTVTLDTRALNRIEDKLYRLAIRVDSLVDELSTAIYHVEKNHKNIVAAHKAHRTMAIKTTRAGNARSGIDAQWMLRVLTTPDTHGDITALLSASTTNMKKRYRLARYLAANVNGKLLGRPNQGDTK